MECCGRARNLSDGDSQGETRSGPSRRANQHRQPGRHRGVEFWSLDAGVATWSNGVHLKLRIMESKAGLTELISRDASILQVSCLLDTTMSCERLLVLA